ncbi:hypothetical protein EXIGLDRAFT_517857 [Exidia glandulosa HHB12029]|uniref:Uncharacterized protein n=1 Tax=Exidia glandulosa HHB12029 TaxID=1314781 RepID=A0A166N2B8_EXIGL|nr:hypothetical protein EXIGLDRAFT_517857 [Exidia glandulosa HHB12029]
MRLSAVLAILVQIASYIILLRASLLIHAPTVARPAEQPHSQHQRLGTTTALSLYASIRRLCDIRQDRESFVLRTPYTLEHITTITQLHFGSSMPYLPIALDTSPRPPEVNVPRVRDALRRRSLQGQRQEHLRQVGKSYLSSSPCCRHARLRGHPSLLLIARIGAHTVCRRRCGPRAAPTRTLVYSPSQGRAAHFLVAVSNCSSVGPSIDINVCESLKRTSLLSTA